MISDAIQNKAGSIGIFDSGLGGLTLAKSIIQAMPNANIIYLGDTARLPYGTKGAQIISLFTKQAFDFFQKHSVAAVVVACHTVSTIGFSVVNRSRLAFPIIDASEILLADLSNKIQRLNNFPKKIALLGTKATINSGVYQKKLKDLYPTIDVCEAACPLFVPLIEEGIWEGELARLIIETHCHKLKEIAPEIVCLCCTHYPLIKDELQNYFQGALFADASTEAAQILKARLPETQLLKNARRMFYVTDYHQNIKDLFQRILGGLIGDFSLQQVSLG
ncbi:MAG TPA: glutamate racemase [Oligoflexia bacterium]|nr:glutamate racemase [Oligoflexia bacterium]HMP27664.1 glutamate racemase [Oligoflexia bacterium]